MSPPQRSWGAAPREQDWLDEREESCASPLDRQTDRSAELAACPRKDTSPDSQVPRPAAFVPRKTQLGPTRLLAASWSKGEWLTIRNGSHGRRGNWGLSPSLRRGVSLSCGASRDDTCSLGVPGSSAEPRRACPVPSAHRGQCHQVPGTFLGTEASPGPGCALVHRNAQLEGARGCEE